jgi:hypothetical protein
MIPLVYTKDPGKFWGFAIPPLAMGGGAWLGRFRRGRRRSRLGERAEGRRSSPRAYWCSEFGRRGTYGVARWWPAATAAVCGGSGDGVQCRAKKQRHTPLGVLGSRSRWRIGRECERVGELGGVAAMAAGGSVWCEDGGDSARFL